MDKTLYQLILASQSPRRKELLGYLGVQFSIQPSSLEEKTSKTLPADVVKDLALLKARDIYQQNLSSNLFVIGSDTIVVLDNKILGKPKDREDAYTTLEYLSGKTHEVLSAVSYVFDDQELTFYESTLVSFRELSSIDIKTYLDFNEYADKAGSYGIQGAAQSYIEKVDGNYSNVVGFPLERMITEFEKLFGPNWRERFA